MIFSKKATGFLWFDKREFCITACILLYTFKNTENHKSNKFAIDEKIGAELTGRITLYTKYIGTSL